MHTETRLADGRPAIMVDCGSVGNLTGSVWALDHAKEALKHHRRPEQILRERPLRISGVGTGSQQATHNVKIPICMKATDGSFLAGSFETPTVDDSMLPALLGLHTTRSNRGIIDTRTLRLHFCGPGPLDLEKVLPPGSYSIQCELSPSGHMVIPCAEFAAHDDSQKQGSLRVEQVSLPVSSSSWE